MPQIEFETHIENGTIAIPPQYQQVLGDRVQVKVTVSPAAEVVATQPSLFALLSRSPLSRLEFEQPGVRSPIRAVEL